MFRTRVDLTTGKVSHIDLTAEEIAEAQARTAAEQVMTPAKSKAIITQKEREALLPRALREFVLSRLSKEEIAGNPGYQALKKLDDEINEMRSQIRGVA